MRIMLVNKYLYPRGGDAISTLNTGRLLSAKGHEVVYWGMDHPDNPEYPYQPYFIKNADYDKANGTVEKIRLAANLLYSFEAKQKIEKVIKEIKPDIIHLNNYAHQISPSILHAIHNLRLPVVATLHDFKYVCASYLMMNKERICEKCKNGRYFRCLTSKCIKNSTAKSLLNTVEMYLHHDILKIYSGIKTLISPSLFLIKKMKEMGYHAKFAHLPNFVKIKDIKPYYNWDEQSIYYLGRLSKEKGLTTLLEAMRGIEQISLKIIGDGPQRTDLELICKKYNMKNIKFLGYKSGDDLENEIVKSMALVMPSECYENNPLAILESFAYGKPAIGSEIGGIPELVRNGTTGYTFQAGNPDDLRNKIIMLAKNNGNLYDFGRNARKIVEEEYNSRKFYSQLLEIYGDAVAAK